MIRLTMDQYEMGTRLEPMPMEDGTIGDLMMLGFRDPHTGITVEIPMTGEAKERLHEITAPDGPKIEVVGANEMPPEKLQ